MHMAHYRLSSHNALQQPTFGFPHYSVVKQTPNSEEHDSRVLPKHFPLLEKNTKCTSLGAIAGASQPPKAAQGCCPNATAQWRWAQPVTAAAVQWRAQESHLQDELNQTNRDREDAQKHCADLQRRHAQAQHEIRRKVYPVWHLEFDRPGLLQDDVLWQDQACHLPAVFKLYHCYAFSLNASRSFP